MVACANWISSTIHHLLISHQPLMLTLNLLQTEHFKHLLIYFPPSEIVSQLSHDIVPVCVPLLQRFIDDSLLLYRFALRCFGRTSFHSDTTPLKYFTLHSVVPLVLTCDCVLKLRVDDQPFCPDKTADC